MRKLFKERKLFKGGNYMRKYSISALKSIKYPRNPLKESQLGENIPKCQFLYSSPGLKLED